MRPSIIPIHLKPALEERNFLKYKIYIYLDDKLQHNEDLT
jgi:hypothetical protein